MDLSLPYLACVATPRAGAYQGQADDRLEAMARPEDNCLDVLFRTFYARFATQRVLLLSRYRLSLVLLDTWGVRLAEFQILISSSQWCSRRREDQCA